MNTVMDMIMNVLLDASPGITITEPDGTLIGEVQMSPYVVVHANLDGSFHAETNVPGWVGPNRRVHTREVTVWIWYSTETARILGKLGYERIEKWGCIDGMRSSGPLTIVYENNPANFHPQKQQADGADYW